MNCNVPGSDPRKWNPADGGWIMHVVSTVSEWVVAICFCLYILSFAQEFREITFTHPQVGHLIFNFFQLLNLFRVKCCPSSQMQQVAYTIVMVLEISFVVFYKQLKYCQVQYNQGYLDIARSEACTSARLLQTVNMTHYNPITPGLFYIGTKTVVRLPALKFRKTRNCPRILRNVFEISLK